MGLRLHWPGRRVLLSVIIIVIAILGVGAVVFQKHQKSADLKKASELVKKLAPTSTPSDEYDKALISLADKTSSASEKYQSYLKLCNSYDMKGNLKAAKEYCDKAVAIADQAGVKAEDKKATEKIANYVTAKLDYANKTQQSIPNGYAEPNE